MALQLKMLIDFILFLKTTVHCCQACGYKKHSCVTGLYAATPGVYVVFSEVQEGYSM